MTKEIINYLTRDLMKQGKILKHSQGLRPLHTDFINNDESQGYRVTFVDGTDDPNNSPEAIQRELEFQRQKILREKLKNRTISQPELLELLEKLL